MIYAYELLDFNGPLDYFFAEHLQETVPPAFHQDPEVVREREFNGEFDYICDVLARYTHIPIHTCRLGYLVELSHEGIGLTPDEMIVAGELALLTCGFFRRQSKTRGRSEYPLRYYATVAARLYLQLGYLGESYTRVSRHFGQWTDALHLLAKRFEEQSLAPYLIKISDDKPGDP